MKNTNVIIRWFETPRNRVFLLNKALGDVIGNVPVSVWQVLLTLTLRKWGTGDAGASQYRECGFTDQPGKEAVNFACS